MHSLIKPLYDSRLHQAYIQAVFLYIESRVRLVIGLTVNYPVS
jgi:hypothetical protein